MNTDIPLVKNELIESIIKEEAELSNEEIPYVTGSQIKETLENIQQLLEPNELEEENIIEKLGE